jgi:hypothetical protein
LSSKDGDLKSALDLLSLTRLKPLADIVVRCLLGGVGVGTQRLLRLSLRSTSLRMSFMFVVVYLASPRHAVDRLADLLNLVYVHTARRYGSALFPSLAPSPRLSSKLNQTSFPLFLIPFTPAFSRRPLQKHEVQARLPPPEPPHQRQRPRDLPPAQSYQAHLLPLHLRLP